MTDPIFLTYFRLVLQPALITLALIGKLCMVGAFGTIYVLSTETFPTVVRNAGMGASSAIARVGSMIAPYIAKSVSYNCNNCSLAASDSITTACL